MNVPLHVLIVDDDPDILLITELALQLSGGWVVKSAASTAEAVAMLADLHTVDVVLADVSMPGGGGLALMREVHGRDATRDTPVVLFTASVRQHDVDRFLAAGAVGVIGKPFDRLTLGGELRRILAARDA